MFNKGDAMLIIFSRPKFAINKLTKVIIITQVL